MAQPPQAKIFDDYFVETFSAAVNNNNIESESPFQLREIDGSPVSMSLVASSVSAISSTTTDDDHQS